MRPAQAPLRYEKFGIEVYDEKNEVVFLCDSADACGAFVCCD